MEQEEVEAAQLDFDEPPFGRAMTKNSPPSAKAPVRYVPNTRKAVEVILWLASHKHGIDVYHIVKCAFYADKYHINKYGRPIVGDVYDAGTYGPLPKVVYGLIRRNPLEMLAVGSNGHLPFTVDDAYAVLPSRDANAELLSDSDVEALSFALREYGDKSFDELVRLTHAEPAYRQALGGVMDYRLFLDPNDPDFEGKLQEIEETAPFAYL